MAQKTPHEEWQEAEWLHKQLLETVLLVMDRWARKTRQRDPEAAAWLEAYAQVQTPLEGENRPDAYLRVKAWLKENRPRGPLAEWLKWERTYFAIRNCGTEYVGWQPKCCPERTRALAVPIGCNHRLCPKCAYLRSIRARIRVKTMFDRLTHPALYTLTIPNLLAISKADFKRFRNDAREWIGQRTAKDMICACGHGREAHKEVKPDGETKKTLLGCRTAGCSCAQWHPVSKGASLDYEFLGGIYSMETTYNRKAKTWHLHAHILGDMNRKLPSKTIQDGGKTKLNRVEFYGRHVLAFTALKWRMEFDWLQLTTPVVCDCGCSREDHIDATGKRKKLGGCHRCGEHCGKWKPIHPWGTRPKNQAPKKSLKVRAKWRRHWEAYWAHFERWVRSKREHTTIDFKVKRGRKWFLRSDLSAVELAEYKRREAWNAVNTRVFHLQPVDDREGAAREVLKYITKVADFSDKPEAIEEFCNAARGARMVQTFGTWYGFVLEVQFDPQHMEDWSKRPNCACGNNHWEKIGVFHGRDTEMDETGRWLLKKSALKDHLRGTVARPRIRGSDPQGECDDRSQFGIEWEDRNRGA